MTGMLGLVLIMTQFFHLVQLLGICLSSPQFASFSDTAIIFQLACLSVS